MKQPSSVVALSHRMNCIKMKHMVSLSMEKRAMKQLLVKAIIVNDSYYWTSKTCMPY